jgi:RNA polymerase sigma-70 factor (ECF subfamily)
MQTADPEHREAQLQAWLTASARGEIAAFEQLYTTLSPQLFGVLLRILKRKDLAEEALQDTFSSVWLKASEYRADRGRVSTWIFTIGRYRAFDVLRRGRREVNYGPAALTELDDMLSARERTEEGEPRSLAEYRRLQECLEGLSTEQRRSIALAYFRDRTQEEISAALKAPLGTVKSWVRRALIGLKRCLEQ